MKNRNVVPVNKGWPEFVGYTYLNNDDEHSIIFWIGKFEGSFAWLKKEPKEVRKTNSKRR